MISPISAGSVLVTGANGIVGTQVVQNLVNRGYSVHALVRQLPPPGHPLYHESVRIHLMDLACMSEKDLHTLFTEIHPVALLHCGALVNADVCEKQQELAYAVNTTATRLLATICACYQVYCLMVSTDYVYNGKQAENCLYYEDDSVQPLNFYGYSKLQGELAIQEACIGRTRWSICRTAVVYGTTTWSRPDFSQWLLAALRQGKSVSVVYDQFSSPTSSWDLANMLIQLMSLQAEGIYHTAGSSVIDRYNFSCQLARRLGLDVKLISPIATSKLQQQARRPLNAGLNVDKVSALLGARPLTIVQGIEHHYIHI